MRLDEKYFGEMYLKLGKFGIAADINFLKQIALDAAREQTTAIIDAVVIYMDKCHKDNLSGRFLCPSGYELICSIQSALITEFPHE